MESSALTGDVGAVSRLTTGGAPRPPSLLALVRADLKWSFTWPMTWLTGVAANLVLSLLWLAYDPLTGHPYSDWAIVVGSYFAVFILADVTTTNVLGADTRRVRLGLARGLSLRRILLVKNLTLMVVVGVPTLLATSVITIWSEADYRLLLTLPGVLFPILVWLGVGNLVSVALPVSHRSLRQRWAERRQFRSNARWVTAVGLPYALYGLVSPLGGLPRMIARTLLPAGLVSRGSVVCLLGLALYGLGTWGALALGRRRSIPFDDGMPRPEVSRDKRQDPVLNDV